VNNDGEDELVISLGATSKIKIFNHEGVLLKEFEVGASGGADFRVAVGDTDGDAGSEIILSRGAGSVPKIFIYEADGTLKSELFVYAENMDKGVFVSSVSNGAADALIVGTENGAGPQVRVFDKIGALVSQFFAHDETNRGGVAIAGGASSIYTIVQNGGAKLLREFDLRGNLLKETELKGFINNASIDAWR
jgi:hypothetical protein